MAMSKLCTYLYMWLCGKTDINPLDHSNLITCLTSFFWKKNPVRLQKKKKKKRSTLVSYGRKWFLEIFSQTQKKKEKKVFSALRRSFKEFYELSRVSTINSQTDIDMIMLRIGC